MFVLLAGIVTLGSVQLASAEISIDVGERSATVEARYRLVEIVDPVRFVMIRLREQSVHLTNTAPGDVADIRASSGLYEFTVAPSRSGELIVSVRYEVTGNLDRIPILNPDVATAPGSKSVHIRVNGIAADAALKDAFPRLVLDANGVASASLENLPSLVRLPSLQGTWSTNRVAEVVVALLVLFATLIWIVRRRLLGIGQHAGGTAPAC